MDLTPLAWETQFLFYYFVIISDLCPYYNFFQVYISALKINNSDIPKQEAVINHEIDRLLQRIQSQNGLPQDITKDILLATANVFCAMVFGSRYELGDPAFIRIVEIGSGLFTMLANGFLVDVLPWLKFFPFKSIQTFQELCKDRDEIFGIYQEHVEANRVQNPRNLTDALLKARQEAE